MINLPEVQRVCSAVEELELAICDFEAKTGCRFDRWMLHDGNGEFRKIDTQKIRNNLVNDVLLKRARDVALAKLDDNDRQALNLPRISQG